MDNTEAVTEEKGKVRNFITKFGIFAVVLLIVFLLGFVPMWMNLRTANAEHEVTKKALVKEEILNSLTTGIIDARRGEYEPARQDASDFFSKLRAEIEKEKESAYSAEQIGNLKNIFDNRDAMITLLAQRDQASVERLTDVYLKYQQAVGNARPETENKPSEANVEPANTQ
ncbi:MAG: hypothetical protein M3405_12295 [Acidobacteriota bacterium]|nr:hypothetical protein [Acidobacteriota bacterium]